MENPKDAGNKLSTEDRTSDFYTSKLETEDIEFILNIKKSKNPGELLEKLYFLRENEELSDDEKTEEMKKIMSDYMR